jgi:probable addiction module antidote protein
MKIKLTEYDGTNFLKSREDIEEYLKLAFESDDPKMITRALGNVAKLQNLSEVARKTGLNRVGLHRSFSGNGDPKFSTLSNIVSALGYQLTITQKPNCTSGVKN